MASPADLAAIATKIYGLDTNIGSFETRSVDFDDATGARAVSMGFPSSPEFLVWDSLNDNNGSAYVRAFRANKTNHDYIGRDHDFMYALCIEE